MRSVETPVLTRTQDAVANWDVTQPIPTVTTGSLALSDGQTVPMGQTLVDLINQVLTALAAHKAVHVEGDEEFISPERAAELLQVSRPTIYAWQDRGRLPLVERGNRRLIPISDVLAFRTGATRRREIQDSLRQRSRQDDDTPIVVSKEVADTLAPDDEYGAILNRIQHRASKRKTST